MEASSIRPVAGVGVRHRGLRAARAKRCVGGVRVVHPGRLPKDDFGKCVLKPTAIFVVLSKLR